MAEEVVLGHVLAMEQCSSIQRRVADEGRQADFGPLLIGQFNHPLGERRRSERSGLAGRAPC